MEINLKSRGRHSRTPHQFRVLPQRQISLMFSCCTRPVAVRFKRVLYVDNNSTKLIAVALVRKRSIPTERPALVGEASANFCRKKVSRGRLNGFSRPLISAF
jgi:hypothetical protein